MADDKRKAAKDEPKDAPLGQERDVRQQPTAQTQPQTATQAMRAAAEQEAAQRGDPPPRPVTQQFGGNVVVEPVQQPPEKPDPNQQPLSGFPEYGKGPNFTDQSNQVNPDPNAPTTFDRDKIPSQFQVADPFLPAQTTVNLESDVLPGTVAIVPYGTDPQFFDPSTGQIIPTPVKSRELTELNNPPQAEQPAA